LQQILPFPETGKFDPLFQQLTTGQRIPIFLDIQMTLFTHTAPLMMAITAFQRLKTGAVQLAALILEEITSSFRVEIQSKIAFAPLKAGDSTAKENLGETSSIICLP
jgi:hypothetical protein